MTGIVINQTRTNRFLGVCKPCTLPVATEADKPGSMIHGNCPECGNTVKLDRLVAVTTMDVCDSRCMGAVGPSCSCGCGGTNHGRAFGPTATHYETEKAVNAYRATVAKKKAAAEKRAETKKAKSIGLYTAWVEGLPADEQQMIAWLLDYDNVADSGFLVDMRLHVLRASKGDSKYPEQPLTDRQYDAVRRCYQGKLKFAAAKAAQDAAAKPVPTGKALTVQGEIVSIRYQDNNFGPGGSYKMLVKGDGWKIWSTVPQNLLPSVYNMVELDAHLNGMKGQQVRFVADVATKDDPSFGLAKRPRQAEILAA